MLGHHCIFSELIGFHFHMHCNILVVWRLMLMVNYIFILQAAANCYIELIVKESDNNVKLIVLDRLVALKDAPQQEKILQELAMDVLRILTTPDLEVRKKTLNLGKSAINDLSHYSSCISTFLVWFNCAKVIMLFPFRILYKYVVKLWAGTTKNLQGRKSGWIIRANDEWKDSEQVSKEVKKMLWNIFFFFLTLMIFASETWTWDEEQRPRIHAVKIS